MWQAVEEKNSRVCLGLDPRLERIPPFVCREADGPGACLLAFNQRIIEAAAEHAVVAKPQVAFYEMYGPPGMAAFAETVRCAKEHGLIVIADVKRGDIGSTAAAYARAYLGPSGEQGAAFDVDAVTLNPYLGSDSVEPFLAEVEASGKGLFVLVKTSNKSSAEIQDLEVAGQPVYQHVAGLVARWAERLPGERGYSGVGAVVGATFPEQAAELRQVLPGVPFLLPGYGAQGASAEDVACCFDEQGYGAVVNSSRGIIFAYEGAQWEDRQFAEAAAEAARRMKEEINEAIRPG
ncbi:MAG: orotidine-5'-phosphate decarboxylase [Armatimonadota bacterium]